LELELDLDTGDVRLRGELLERERRLSHGEFTALAILLRARGQKCTYSELLPGSVAADKPGRAQGLISGIKKKLDGWLRGYLEPIPFTLSGTEGGYAFKGPVAFGNSPKDRDSALRQLSQSRVTLFLAGVQRQLSGLLWSASGSPRQLRFRTVAVIILVVAALGTAFMIRRRGLQLNQAKETAGTVEHRPAVLVDNAAMDQSPFETYFGVKSTYPVRWRGSYSITNLESQAIAIKGFTIEFPPLHHDGHTWELKGDINGPLFARTFDSVEDLRQSRRVDILHTSSAPFVLKAGEKKYYIFELLFQVFRDGERVPDILLNGDVLVHALVGGRFDENQKPYCGFIPIRTLLKLHDERLVQQDTL
jgi:hypothetical protein